jgi:Flp pilus assembly pilin Flp
MLDRGMACAPVLPERAVNSAQATSLRATAERSGKEMTFSDCLDLITWARKRQEGQTMAEYAVVLGVITAGVIVAITALSGGVSGALSAVTGRI